MGCGGVGFCNNTRLVGLLYVLLQFDSFGTLWKEFKCFGFYVFNNYDNAKSDNFLNLRI